MAPAVAAQPSVMAPSAAMHQPRRWISLWFAVSSLVVIWDMGYIFLRPRSMKGGNLFWLWKPYELYGTIDYIYGLPSWSSRDGFPAAQSIMNLFETLLNFTYLFLVYVRGSADALAAAPIVALVTATMTLSKTILYVLNDFCCGWCKTGHNTWSTLIFLWIIPNGLWILVPSLILKDLIIELYSLLRVSAAGRVKGTSNSTAASKKPSKESNDTSLSHKHRLIEHDQLPAWAKDNPLIRRGYRRPGGTGDEAKKSFEHDTFAKCWRSVWAYWHNETVNIHTHMWGALFALTLSSTHLLQHFQLLPAFVRPLSHHPIFYPSSLTFTTTSGKVLRLASASYPATRSALSNLVAPSGSPIDSPHTNGLLSASLAALRSILSPRLGVAATTTAKLHTTLDVRPPDRLDVLGFATFFAAAMICLGFSASYHTVGCHSHYVSRVFNRMDYIGIVVMIVGSFLPALHYGFYCHPHFQLAYSVAITLMGSVAVYVVIAPKYGTPQYRPYRTSVFLILGLSAIFPILHIVNVYGYETITSTMGLRFLITSGALYVVGALLYMLRIPERFAPGRFDLVGSSHQIFHCLILAAAAAHYISLRRAYGFWHTVEGLGGTGKEGVCRALES